MKKKILVIIILMLVSILSGCTSEPEISIHTGILKDVKYIQGSFDTREQVTLLFEDGFTITHDNSRGMKRQSTYIFAENNIGKLVEMEYERGTDTIFSIKLSG